MRRRAPSRRILWNSARPRREEKGRFLCREAAAALAPAALEQGSPGAGAHAAAEAMLPLATANIGLERTFHGAVLEKGEWVGPTGYGGGIPLSKVKPGRGNAGCVAKECLAAAGRGAPLPGKCWLLRIPYPTMTFGRSAGARVGPTARFVVLVGPLGRFIYSPPAGRPENTSPESDRSRPAGWTEGAAPRGAVSPQLWIGLWRTRRGARRTQVEAHSPAEWDQFRRTLRGRVTPVTWQTWLEGLQPGGVQDGVVSLLAPSEFHLRWVNDKFRPIVEAAVSSVLGAEARLVIDARTEPLFPEGEEDEEADTFAEPADLPSPSSRPGPLPGLVAKYTFENFVVGPSNRFAHAAAMAVAEQPGGHYNPLFVYGGAGLGKTHLLQAIAQHAATPATPALAHLRTRRRSPSSTTSSTGSAASGMDEFKARYRGMDILLLDDVQFLEGKEQTPRGVLPHVQRAARQRQAARVRRDRPPRSLMQPGGPPAQPLRVGPDHRHPAARRRDPPRHPAPECRVRAHHRCPPTCSSSSPSGSWTTSANWKGP